MPCEEGVNFICDGVSRVLDFPEVFRVAALIGVVDTGCLSVSPVDSLKVDARRHIQGGEVPCKVRQKVAAPV